MSAAGRGGILRAVDGLSPRNDPVARLHRFQGEHPEVTFTAPHMGGQGRYIALLPGRCPRRLARSPLTASTCAA